MTKQDEKEVQVKLMNIFKKYNKITHKRMAEILFENAERIEEASLIKRKIEF